MSYFHLRMFWGAFDTTYVTPGYTGAALVSGGASAAAGSGVGVRRCNLVFSRVPPGAVADDVCVMHFDFINFTGGVPDDTWTSGDYTTMNNHVYDYWTAIKSTMSNKYTLQEFRWYRVGTGVVPPNPPENINPVGTGGGGTGASSLQVLPPQVACSLTLKTAQRKQWGRTYIPGLLDTSLASSGTFTSTFVNAQANALHTLVTDAQSDDFAMGVLSKVAGSFFLVEQIQVDDIADVIRRRRWKTPTLRVDKP